jgi:hypothetical protein
MTIEKYQPTGDSLAGTVNYGSYPARILLPPGTFNPTQETVNPVGVVSSVGGAGGGNAQVTTNGTAVNAGTAQAQTPVTVAGVTTSSVASWSLPNAPDATWQTGIAVMLVCTANTVTVYLVNPTAGPITPIAQAINIAVQL